MRARTSSRFLRFIPALAVGASALIFAAPGASASATSTFTLTSGTLSITEPAGSNIGTAAAGAPTVSGSLGNVSVADTRGSLTATWTATASSTNFTTGTSPGTYQTVTNSNISYTAGLPTSTSGVGTFTPGTLTSMATSGQAGAWAGTGNNAVTWDPTIVFTLSPSQVAGTYSGTITDSVA